MFKKINKKAVVEDWFDLMFLTLISILAFYFLYTSVVGPQDLRNDKEIARVVDFREFHTILVDHEYEQYQSTKQKMTTSQPEENNENNQNNQDKGVNNE